MLTHVKAQSPRLAAELERIEKLPTPEQKAKAFKDIVQMILDYISQHPGEMMNLIAFIVSLFGGTMPIPAPTPPA